MKKILVLLTAGVLLAILIVSCDDTAKKKDLPKAESDLRAVASATGNATKAKAEAEWKLFKYTSDTTLAKLEFRAKAVEKHLASKTVKNRAALQGELDKTMRQLNVMQDQLNMKNKEFEQEMKAFDQAVYNRNRAFQREFNHDMNDFGIAFSNLFKDNVQ